MAARTICKQGSDLAGEPMADYAPAEASRAGTGGPARRHARFLERADPPGRLGRAARVDAEPEAIRDLAYSIIRVLNRDGEAVGPWAGLLERRRIARRPAQHDDAARLRRAHADGAAPGQDLVLHAAHGRGGGELRVSQGAAAGRHEFPDLSAGGTADRRRLFAGRHDVPDLSPTSGIR